MGNSQSNSPAKNERVPSESLRGKHQLDNNEEQYSNQERQHNKAGKRKGGQGKRSHQRETNSNKLKKSNVVSSITSKATVKVPHLKDEMSDKSLDSDCQQEKKLSSGKHKATQETSLAKNMATAEEPLVSGKITLPEDANKKKDGHQEKQAKPHYQTDLSLRKPRVGKNATNVTVVSGNVSTSASLPSLVVLRGGCRQSKIVRELACLDEERDEAKATGSSSIEERSSTVDAAHINKEQIGGTSKNDEIRVVLKARIEDEIAATTLMANRLETLETEKLHNIVNSTNFPTSLNRTDDKEEEEEVGGGGALSLASNFRRSSSSSNSNKPDYDYGDNKMHARGRDRDQPAKRYTEEGTMKPRSGLDRGQGDAKNAKPERSSLESICLDLGVNSKPSSFDHKSGDSINKRNNSSAKIGAALPPLVTQKNVQHANEGNRQIRERSSGLSRSFSFNTILVNGANLLNLSSVVARQMKIRASNYGTRQADHLKRACSPSATTTSTTATPTMRILQASTTRLPMINDTLLMMQSTNSTSPLMFKLSSVEDQSQKVKDWLESQPLLGLSSSVDQLDEEGKVNDKDEGRRLGEGQDSRIGVEEKEMRQEESDIKWKREEVEELGWCGLEESIEIGRSFSCPLVMEQEEEEEEEEGEVIKRVNREEFDSSHEEAISVSELNYNNDNKAAKSTSETQKQMKVAISDIENNAMERKLATNKASRRQDNDDDDRAILARVAPGASRKSVRSHLLDDDYNDNMNELCVVALSNKVDNQPDEGNFDTRKQNRKNNSPSEGEDKIEAKKSDAGEEYCSKNSKVMEKVLRSASGKLARQSEENIDEILDDKPEASERKIGEVNVCGQVTDESTSSTTSLFSLLSSEADKLFSSGSKSEAIEAIRQRLADSLSSMQMSLKHSRLKSEEKTLGPTQGTEDKPQVADTAASGERSGCSLCNYLNSIRYTVLGRHEQCNSSYNSDKNIDVNNGVGEQKSQLGKQKLQFKQQLNQVEEHGNQQHAEGVSFGSIKSRELAELSIWNNLRANLSADVYKYELEANLMIRRPTRGSCYRNSCCSARDNDGNNESGTVDIRCGGCGINSKVQASNELHALNNQTFQPSLSLHNDQMEKERERESKIDEVLCDDSDAPAETETNRVVSKNSTNLKSLLNLTNKPSYSSKALLTSQKKTDSNCIRKQPALKSLRGLSLDSNNKQRNFEAYPIPTFRERLNSRRLLTNQGKSQSTKLILIKSNNASYTIQATPTSSFDYNVELNSIKGENEQKNQFEKQVKQNQDQVKTNGKILGNQTSITEQINKQSNSVCFNNDDRNGSNVISTGTEITTKSGNNNNYNSGDSNKGLVDSDKQTLNQFGLCKKFLVKKIKKPVCSNRKLLFNKQQASYRQTFHLGALANNRYEKQIVAISSQQKLIQSRQLSTSNIHPTTPITSNTKIAFNKSNSTNTFDTRLNKLCDVASSLTSIISKRQLSDELSPTCERTTLADDQQNLLDSLVSEPALRRVALNRSLESLSSCRLLESEFESMNDEEEETKRNRLISQANKADSKILRELLRQSANSPASVEQQNREIIDSQESIDIGTISNKLEMDTVRMNIQGAKTAEVIDAAGGMNSIETARSCGVAAQRLRELVAHLEHGSVPQSILYQTLEYAASVLDSVTMDQVSRASDEEDGDLSEVQSDAVPNEVRKWLETTFTRNSISQKRKSEDKLKFRSVANAIRAGIVVDRIYRRTSACIPFVSQEVSNLLKNIDDWSFDCFSVNQVSNGQVLKSVGYELFNRYGLIYKFKIPTTTLKNFLTQIECGYVKHKNPYHNNLHAADVTQTVHYMLWQAGLTNWLTDLEIFATLLAAIIHDYLHTGTTNNFHVMSQSDTALIYNDRAVLENFHICQAFTLMKNEDCNILANLSKDEYREFRSLVIDMVLATDMSSHFQQIKAMKNILNHSDNFNADKSKILSLVIHISDISHPAKEWELHSTWTRLLMEEFFRQGDREKELDLECSPLCDRETTLVAESQLGFIEFIVSPSLEVCGDVLDRVHYQMAEANSRPVLPASAKAVSMVAASANQSTSNKNTNQLQAINSSKSQQSAIEAGTPTSQTKQEEPQSQSQSQKRGPLKQASSISDSSSSSVSALGFVTSTSSTQQHHQQQHQSQPQPQPQPQQVLIGPRSPPASQSSIASSFVSSESITSNLRKMIVSSSATIGRKLNISSSSSSPQNSSNNNNNNNNHSQQQSNVRSQQQQQQQQFSANKSSPGSTTITSINTTNIGTSISTVGRQQSAFAGGSVSDFETRQANYKHPVIQSDPRPKSAGSRFKQAASSDTSFLRQDDNSSELNLQQQSKDLEETTSLCGRNQAASDQQQHSTSQLSRLTQPNEGVIKRSSNSALSTCSQASCPANMQTFKIQRPWVACLERNKKIWHERSITDAQARELKEKLKQRQIESDNNSGESAQPKNLKA